MRLVLLVFLAHSHVHDETCQLKVRCLHPIGTGQNLLVLDAD